MGAFHNRQEDGLRRSCFHVQFHYGLWLSVEYTEKKNVTWESLSHELAVTRDIFLCRPEDRGLHKWTTNTHPQTLHGLFAVRRLKCWSWSGWGQTKSSWRLRMIADCGNRERSDNESLNTVRTSMLSSSIGQQRVCSVPNGHYIWKALEKKALQVATILMTIITLYTRIETSHRIKSHK